MWLKAIKNLLYRDDLYLGIDIGSSSIKAIVLFKLAGEIRLMSVVIVPLSQGTLKNKEVYGLDEFENALKSLRNFIPKPIKKAVIAITGSQVITKIIQVDRSLTEIEVEYYLYGNLKLVTEKMAGEVNIDFTVLGNNKVDENLKDVFVVVAKKNLIDARTASLKRVGFNTAVVDLETHAITRSLQLEYSLASHDLMGVFANLHIGEVTSLFMVLIDGELVFSRELNIGVAQLINKNVDKLTAASKSNDLLNNSSVDKLVAQLRHCQQSYLAIVDERFIEHWVCSGGGSHFPELITYLTNLLKATINICQPLNGLVAIDSKVDLAKQNLLSVQGSFQVALGLAARGLD
jgi:type IV pilus assembly protein PilM